jgi:peptidoglycan/LPS O-acetylase OafA/YrhL
MQTTKSKSAKTATTAKKRDLSYELIRVLAMAFIIFDHNLNPFFGKGSCAAILLEPFFIVGVPLFFMLSGRFAFKLNLEDKSLYKKYYLKKVVGLIIPMLVFMAIKNWHIMVYNQHLDVTFVSYFRHFGIALVNGFSYMEYWFLYTLIALLLAVPFTARMMQNFTDRDKKAFLTVGLIAATISAIIPIVLHVVFAIDYHFIGYTLFFYLGYIVEDIFKTDKQKHRLYLVGLASFIITLVLVKLNITTGYKSLPPFNFFFAFAMFIGLHELGKKLPKKSESLILFLGKHSLSVYMLHMIFLYTINDFNFFPKNVFGWFGSTISVLIISLLAGVILDNTIIKWLQKLATKLFHLEKA